MAHAPIVDDQITDLFGCNFVIQPKDCILSAA